MSEGFTTLVRRNMIIDKIYNCLDFNIFLESRQTSGGNLKCGQDFRNGKGSVLSLLNFPWARYNTQNSPFRSSRIWSRTKLKASLTCGPEQQRSHPKGWNRRPKPSRNVVQVDPFLVAEVLKIFLKPYLGDPKSRPHWNVDFPRQRSAFLNVNVPSW